MEFAQQFQNQAMMDLIRPYDRPREAKAAYYEALLRRFAPVTPPEEAAAQQAADRLVADPGRPADAAQDRAAVETTLASVRASSSRRART
jgi:hypothetical protein